MPTEIDIIDIDGEDSDVVFVKIIYNIPNCDDT
jgi:hypothetical protein